MIDINKVGIAEYLESKGIKYWKIKDYEIKTLCLFQNCDKDSNGDEAHLYINSNGWQFKCQKCGTTGNFKKILEHFGDNVRPGNIPSRNNKFSDELVNKCNLEMPDRIKNYLNSRGVIDSVITEFKLGFGKFWGKDYITFPIKSDAGEYLFFKLREDPEKGKAKISYPSSKDNDNKTKASLFGKIGTDRQIICEGEIDVLSLISHGVDAVTSSHGVSTFKEEWAQDFKGCKEIYICFDNDEAGKIGAKRVGDLFYEKGFRNVYIVDLPGDVGEKGDVNDYLVKLGLPVEDLFTKYSRAYPERIDTKQFQEITLSEIGEILSLTIKKDFENKVITLLAMLGVFSKDAQINVAFNAPSSTGKSHIPLECSLLIPKENVLTYGGVSKTSFIHSKQAVLDKVTGKYVIDLTSKIVILMDMPNYQFLEAMRSFLSRDKDEIDHKITDKNKSKIEAKDIVLKGRPIFIYCSTNSFMDLQEMTRMLILSPEQTSDKIFESVQQTFQQEMDKVEFEKLISTNLPRRLLKLRIEAIKQEQIENINFEEDEKSYLKDKFLFTRNNLQGRHNRDIKRLISLVKCHALLNMWHRKRDGKSVIIDRKDIDAILPIWNKLTEGQDLNLPPYIYDIYTKVIIASVEDKSQSNSEELVGVTRNEIKEKFYKEFGRPMADHDLRTNIIPVLKNAGLVYEEKDKEDKRSMLLYLIKPKV